MSWKDRMATASFRDFEFRTDSHDAKGGRRLVVHQYPGAEVPDVEDLGGKSDEFRLNAYFLGEDYDLERNGFLAKLAEHGADWLMHPWRGKLWVRAHNWSVHESNDKGGFCTVAVDFVPGGGSVQPTPDKVDKAFERIGNLRKAAQDNFALEPMAAPSMTSMIAAVQGQLERMRDMIALASLPLTWMNQVRNVIDGLQGDMAALLALPAQYSAALGSLSDLLGSGADATGLADTARPRVVDALAALAKAPVTMPGGAADSPALHVNHKREHELRCRLLLTSAAQVALADYRCADDRDAVLACVVGALDQMMPDMPDAVFQAAADCRAALIDALLAQNLEPAVSRDVVSPLPATLLAHRMEVDEDVFLAVNKVRHPLFVRGRVNG